MGAEGIWEFSGYICSTQFCCKVETVLKEKVCLKILITQKDSNIEVILEVI